MTTPLVDTFDIQLQWNSRTSQAYKRIPPDQFDHYYLLSKTDRLYRWSGLSPTKYYWYKHCIEFDQLQTNSIPFDMVNTRYLIDKIQLGRIDKNLHL